MDWTKLPEPPARPPWTVLGLGNPVVGDDAAGLHVIDWLREHLPSALSPQVELQTCTRGGFELIDMLNGYERAIIADCLSFPEPVPGKIHRLSLDDVGGSSRLVGGHELSLAQAFAFTKRLSIPMPGQVEILGIEGGALDEFTEMLSPPVAAAVEETGQRILSLLHDWASEPVASETAT